MLKRKILTLALAGMLALTAAPPAWAASGTVDCGSGGEPFTKKLGSPEYREHWLENYTEVTTNGTVVTWPHSSGDRDWYVTPGSGTAGCVP